MRNFQLQPKLRIMSDEITGGIDELGVLLMGHGLNDLVDRLAARHPRGPPAGSGPERDDAPGCGGVLGGLVYMIRQSRRRASSCPTSCPTGRFSRSPARIWAPVRRSRRTGRRSRAGRVCSRNGALRRSTKRTSGSLPVSPSNRDEPISWRRDLERRLRYLTRAPAKNTRHATNRRPATPQ